MAARRAALLLVLSACGGHLDPGRGHTGAVVDGEGGSGGVQARGGAGGLRSASPGGAGDEVASGGVSHESAPAVAGADDGGAEAGPRASPPSIASGTRFCENESYCFGLACYAPSGFQEHACIRGCRSDDDCLPREACLSSTDLEPGCYARCETPFDCEYGFDCFDFANRHQHLVCFPTSWAAIWQAQRR